VQVVFNSCQEQCFHEFFIDPQISRILLDVSDDVVSFFSGPDVGNLSLIQDVIDILEEDVVPGNTGR
jgi:hypothetical protein